MTRIYLTSPHLDLNAFINNIERYVLLYPSLFHTCEYIYKINFSVKVYLDLKS